MKYLIVLLTLLFSTQSYADQEALRQAMKAFYNIEGVKARTKHLEKKAIRLMEENTFLDKETLGIAAVSSSILISGRIGTSQFKGLKTEVLGFTVRPDINYSFYENEFHGLIISNYEF